MSAVPRQAGRPDPQALHHLHRCPSTGPSCQTLGLKTIGDTRECEYTPNVHGMVKRIPYLIDVTVKG